MRILAAITAANADMAGTLIGPKFWLIVFFVTAVCFLSGPFGTLDALPWGIRLIYWALQVSVTGLAGSWVHSLIRTQGWTHIAPLLAISFAFGLAVFGFVVLLSLSLLGPIGRYPGSRELMLYSVPSASLIFLMLALTIRTQAPVDALERPPRPRLLDRLKQHHTAGQILSLSAQDHYVEVVTDTGSELCLIRLVDAIAEVDPEPGFKIHRSHWVAAKAIVSLEVNGSGAQIKLSDGRALPVSRSRLGELRRFLSTASMTSQ